MVVQLNVNNSYIFSKVNSGYKLVAGKEYLLIRKIYKRVQLNAFDGGDEKETSVFLEVIDGVPVQSKQYHAVTNWWGCDISNKDAQHVGEYEVAHIIKYNLKAK